MKKISKYILMVLCLAVMIFSLTACDNYAFTKVEGGNPEADTESNGGSVVKQGDKLYFVNGKTDEKVANKFGDVEKGSIVRVTINADGTLSDDYKIIVPKNVYSKGKENGANGGIYIFNDKIYYLTPYNDKDKNDNLLNNSLDVMCVNLDGTGTKKLGYVDGLEFEYKFTANNFVYYKDNTIFIHDLNNFDNPIKIEDVTSILMPKTENYNKDTKYVTDYIFYTRALKQEEVDDGFRNTVLCAVKCDGTNQIEIINHDTVFDVVSNNPVKNDYSLTLKKYQVFGNNITIYYSRQDVDKLFNEKFCSYTFSLDSLEQADNKVYFDKAYENIIRNSSVAVGDFIPYTEDSVFEIKDKIIYKYQAGKDLENTPVNDNKVGIFPGTFVALREEAGKTVMYYTNNGLYKFVIATNGNLTVEAPTPVFEGSIANNVFGNEFIGNYYYFMDSNNQDYVARIDITKVNNKDSAEFVGLRSTEDTIKLENAKKDK